MLPRGRRGRGYEMKPLVELSRVSKTFGDAAAVHEVSLSIERGKTTVLIGPSGCGKSTLLRLIVGLLQADQGEINFDGVPLGPENVDNVRRRVGYVIQEGGLFPHLTARENILLMARHLGRVENTMFSRLSELATLTRFPEALLERYPVELSGGQHQRAKNAGSNMKTSRDPRIREWIRRALVCSCFAGFLIHSSVFAAEQVQIGSKKFTESYVLGEIVKRQLNDAGISAEHRQGMGGTIILWQALRGGQIDAYPEYTGTIVQEILRDIDSAHLDLVAAELGKAGIGMSKPLGFNNTYALVMRRKRAADLGIHAISDLQNHPELKFGLTHEFLDRQDGWQPLAVAYRLSPQYVAGIDHALGYDALKTGQIDVKDAYSTDAKIAQYDLTVLEDDRKFFPRYDAVLLYRLSLDGKAVVALRELEGEINETTMTRLNAEAERTKDYGEAASLFFGSTSGATPKVFGEGF